MLCVLKPEFAPLQPVFRHRSPHFEALSALSAVLLPHIAERPELLARLPRQDHVVCRIEACGGKAFYAVMRAAADEAPRKQLEKFVSSLRFLGDGPSPACEELE